MAWPVEYQVAALELLAELESSRLEVALVPTRWRMNEGGCIRVAVSKNATWYRRFCEQHLSARRRLNRSLDTKIKRQHTLRALQRIAEGKPTRGVYAERLRPFVQRRAQASLPMAL